MKSSTLFWIAQVEKKIEEKKRDFSRTQSEQVEKYAKRHTHTHRHGVACRTSLFSLWTLCAIQNFYSVYQSCVWVGKSWRYCLPNTEPYGLCVSTIFISVLVVQCYNKNNKQHFYRQTSISNDLSCIRTHTMIRQPNSKCCFKSNKKKSSHVKKSERNYRKYAKSSRTTETTNQLISIGLAKGIHSSLLFFSFSICDHLNSLQNKYNDIGLKQIIITSETLRDL